MAGFIDYSVVITFHFNFIFSVGEPNSDGEYSIGGWPAIIPIIFEFTWIVGLKQLFDATIGNLIAGLKLISLNSVNSELIFGQSIKRHLMDIIDMAFFGVIGIIVILNTKKSA